MWTQHCPLFWSPRYSGLQVKSCVFFTVSNLTHTDNVMCVCERLYCMTTRTITISTRNRPQTSTHFRSCSRIAGRSQRLCLRYKSTDSWAEARRYPDLLRGPTERPTTGDTRPGSPCACVSPSASAAAGWRGWLTSRKYDGQVHHINTSPTSACCFKIKDSATQKAFRREKT